MTLEFDSMMPSEHDMKTDGNWVDRGEYKIPRHLADLYDQGRATVDQLSAIADLFEDIADYETAKASLDGDNPDPRAIDAIFRLEALASDN